MLTATVYLLSAVAAGQTQQHLVEEVRTAVRGRRALGSYAFQAALEMDWRSREGSPVGICQEAEGVWQAPDTGRVRHDRSRHGNVLLWGSEEFWVGRRIWYRYGADWVEEEPLDVAPGPREDCHVGENVKLLERGLRRAERIERDPSQEIDGFPCRIYRVVVYGAAATDLVPDAGNLVLPRRFDQGRIEWTVCIDEDEGILRKILLTGEATMREGSRDGPDTFRVRRTLTLSAHGHARVEIPPELADQIGGEQD